MFAADDTYLRNLEIPIEHRLRKALAPRTPAAQRAGGVEGKLLNRERAIRVNHAGERFAVAARGNLGREGSAERGQISLPHAHSGCHGMAAEFIDEPWVMRGDAVEGIANVHAGHRTCRTAQRSILGAREGNDGAVRPALV